MNRPFTEWCMAAIVECLQRNDARGKGPWETVSPEKLWAKLMEEILELGAAVHETPNAVVRIRSEAADVAATAMMLAARMDPNGAGK